MRRSLAVLALALVTAPPLYAQESAPPPIPAPALAAGAIIACPYRGACSPGLAYPLASWRSLFGRRRSLADYGSGELVGLALKSSTTSALGLGIAHVFASSSGAAAPRTSLALGLGFTMPLSGAGGLSTARPVAFLVLGVGPPVVKTGGG